ncbi:fatty acid desaturase family protein [Ilumatobacter nonamiensis]|uniref:fatty acid desaturase family protein n=1 Tax=Ilumatobacter nonamiensis TaxID=467093 RepID=UPI000344CD17|nr:fatty acid desaturase family protein [Ilumatobacter nonamiensis]
MTRTTTDPLVPTDGELPEVLPTERLNERGMARNPLRADLRRIDDLRNIGTVIGALVLSVGVAVAAGWINTWWSYVLAFFLLGGGHARLNILGHEAAHRLLFSNRRANDWVGRWLLAYPTFQPFQSYRRSHFAHHRDEMGPEEPDLALYRGYPITRDSWRRKMRRDALGNSAYKNFRGLYMAVRHGNHDARCILGMQVVALATTIAVGRPLVYLVWILSWSTLWRVSNRIRSIAEHGGMIRSGDRRLTTHVIRQSLLARMWMVPYNTGWHLAHHVDMGVPWRNLPRFHDELVASGWVTPDLEYPSYRAFIRAATSRDSDLAHDLGERTDAGAGLFSPISSD